MRADPLPILLSPFVIAVDVLVKNEFVPAMVALAKTESDNAREQVRVCRNTG